MLPSTLDGLERLGDDLLAFYRAANRLYLSSVRGAAPAWVARYLDQGKGQREVELARLRRTRGKLPLVIRPDLMALGDGAFVATELDAIPGGIGLLDALMQRYRELGYKLAGDSRGLVGAFAGALIAESGMENPFVAVVVSDESEAYRPEMTWVGERLNQFGVRAITVHPRQIDYEGGRIVVRQDNNVEPVDLIYRFFELHDLKNIPNVELIVYAMKHRRVGVTPPLKLHLEEKSLLALFHHPELEGFWKDEMGVESRDRVRKVIPPTWIVDPAEVPPGAAITPPLEVDGLTVRRWTDLFDLTQRQRRLVLKPSGFSELAWGSRGVTVGHDANVEDWNAAVGRALESYPQVPYVLQPFYNSLRFKTSYYDFDAGEVKAFDARARFSPYYCVENDRARMAGVLVTACPASSKLLHGMADAVMVPAHASPNASI